MLLGCFHASNVLPPRTSASPQWCFTLCDPLCVNVNLLDVLFSFAFGILSPCCCFNQIYFWCALLLFAVLALHALQWPKCVLHTSMSAFFLLAWSLLRRQELPVSSAFTLWPLTTSRCTQLTLISSFTLFVDLPPIVYIQFNLLVGILPPCTSLTCGNPIVKMICCSHAFLTQWAYRSISAIEICQNLRLLFDI